MRESQTNRILIAGRRLSMFLTVLALVFSRVAFPEGKPCNRNYWGLYAHMSKLERHYTKAPYMTPRGAFAESLAARRLNWDEMSADARVEALARFVAQLAKPYETPEILDPAQSEALGKTQAKHQVPAITGNPREDLALQSKRNVTRLKRGRVYRSVPEMKEVEELLDQNFKFRFVHHSAIMADAPSEPILSSRRLEAAGLRGGRNTHPFNKSVMQTDDNVYFYTDFTPKEMTDDDIANLRRGEYGPYALALKDDYAEEHGWVSCYIMYPEDLAYFGKAHAQRAAGPLWKLIDRNPKYTYFPDRGFSIAEDHPELLQPVRDELYKFDFTPADFRAAVRNQMLFKLNQLRQTDPGQFEEYVRRLKTHEPRDAQILYRGLVLREWRMSDFEMKVPVAVPSKEVTYHRGEGR